MRLEGVERGAGLDNPEYATENQENLNPDHHYHHLMPHQKHEMSPEHRLGTIGSPATSSMDIDANNNEPELKNKNTTAIQKEHGELKKCDSEPANVQKGPKKRPLLSQCQNNSVNSQSQDGDFKKKEFFRYRDSRQGKPLPGQNGYVFQLPKGLEGVLRFRRATFPSLAPGWQKHLSDAVHKPPPVIESPTNETETSECEHECDENGSTADSLEVPLPTLPVPTIETIPPTPEIKFSINLDIPNQPSTLKVIFNLRDAKRLQQSQRSTSFDHPSLLSDQSGAQSTESSGPASPLLPLRPLLAPVRVAHPALRELRSQSIAF